MWNAKNTHTHKTRNEVWKSGKISLTLNTLTNACIDKSNKLWWTSQWHHLGRDGVSNHRRLDYLLNRFFRSKSKKTSKLRATGITGDRWFPLTKGQWRGKFFHWMTSSWSCSKRVMWVCTVESQWAKWQRSDESPLWRNQTYQPDTL